MSSTSRPAVQTFANDYQVSTKRTPSGVRLTVTAPPCYGAVVRCDDEAQVDALMSAARAHADAAVNVLQASHRAFGYVEDHDVMAEIYVGSLVSGLALAAAELGRAAEAPPPSAFRAASLPA